MPVDLPTLVAAALAGVLGGAHCAVMCGGIAAGFPAMAPGRPLAVAWQANLGRIGGYVVAGAVAGGLGGGLLRLVRIEALTTGVRMAAGLALVLVALRLLDHATSPDLRLTLVKGADHRFSTPECLALIAETVEALSG